MKLNNAKQLEAFFQFVEEFGESEISPKTKEKLRKTFKAIRLEKECESHANETCRPTEHDKKQ